MSAHIVVSVGLLGAVAAYFALAVFGLESRDPLIVRAAYRAMEVVGWWVILPLSIITLAGGVLAAAGTNWGLLRPWWIVVKLALTVAPILVPARHMRVVSRLSYLASASVLTGADNRLLRVQLVVHPIGGLLVLLAATLLSVYKPLGVTAYGRRALVARPTASSITLAAHSANDEPERAHERCGTRPLRVLAVQPHLISLVLALAIVHLANGGLGGHRRAEMAARQRSARRDIPIDSDSPRESAHRFACDDQ